VPDFTIEDAFSSSSYDFVASIKLDEISMAKVNLPLAFRDYFGMVAKLISAIK
jgi:hypothetical protein